MSGPMTPEEALAKKFYIIPEFVFEAFNELIAQNLDGKGKYATVKQDDVVERIYSKMSDPNRSKIFTEHWLDVESFYKNVGWDVKYDAPGYCETYDATFTFTKKKVLTE